MSQAPLSKPSTILELIRSGKDTDAAFYAPGRTPLSYSGLIGLSDKTRKTLRGAGIRRNDRVAIVLPNGPEMGAAFAALSTAAATAPLNPAYTEEEFAHYLESLDAGALVVEKTSDSPAIPAAQKLGLQIIYLSADAGKAAGDFDLLADSIAGAATDDEAARPDDIALVLHTSGTVSKPKIVPLSHSNVCASADSIMTSLRLTRADRCMNIMPLFHIHGLVAAVLSSLRAGASIYCTPGFNALKFFSWMKDADPTWYTAVPTMHQAILSRASRNENSSTISDHPLRLIRSSSSPLPPQVMADLESMFNAPVIEAYGMTEASHQIASNPLPPGERKPGTVGLAAGPEVGIMSKDGALLPNGAAGEIVIRGANVTEGYENNPKANEQNFTDGWFKTGDQGVVDEDGYISITGRLKEIINRGGEKISPQEVDEILLNHPAIRQCVTFAVPHAKLGEDVAAAVVLHEDEQSDENIIRNFAAGYLADFKVPRKILIVEEIPQSATGKLQRIGLAEKLGLTE